MPTISVNRREFEKYVGKKIPTEKLKERISYLGTDLEEVTDDEITVEIFPNRPDMLSLQGFARAFSSFIGCKTGLQHYKVEISREKVVVEKSVKDVRPYTACAIVKGLNFTDEKIKEVIDVQEKLHVTYGRHRKKVAIGVYPLERIKTPIRFVGKKSDEIKFRPLEAEREMSAKEILEKHPTGREYAHLLEGMNKYPLFLDANGEVLSMPPIINSYKVGRIDEKTRDVFIECSGFDFEVMKRCLNMIVTTLADMGGKVFSMDLHYENGKHVTPNLEPEEKKLDLKYINKLLGLDLKEKGAKMLLEMMGYGYKNGKVLIPPYRADILHQADLAEDIAIANGYENFEASIPEVATIAEENSFEIFKKKISELLIGLGFLEASTYNLTNKEIQCLKMNCDMPLITLANSISSDYNALRAWVVPSTMEILSQNTHREYPQKIFSIGKVFKQNSKEEANVEENERLAASTASEKTDYTEARQVIDYILNHLDVNHEVSAVEHPSFVEGRVARISVKGKGVAYVGEISPRVLEKWELETPVTAFELNMTDLYNLIKKEK